MSRYVARIHMTDADEPLVKGQTYRAACELDVENVAFVFIWDTEEMDLPALNTFRMCRKCMGAHMLGRYVYAIVPGGEGRQMERD